jgi:molybdopterin converting factor small subunit
LKYRIKLLGLGGIGRRIVEIEGETPLTAAQLLARVRQLDQNGRLQTVFEHCMFVVDGRDIRHAGGWYVPLPESADISIVPPITGG